MGRTLNLSFQRRIYMMKSTLSSFMLALFFIGLVTPAPWYQGDGLTDCAPGKCPPTAEVSPIKCSSDLKMFFNNGFPTNCPEGLECDAGIADAASGNPCRPVEAKK